MTTRYHLARWNLLCAQASFEVQSARYNGKPTAALVLWAEICEMRRAQAKEDLTSNPVL